MTENAFENNLLAAAVIDVLKKSLPPELRNTLIDNLFERAKTALISCEAMQNEIANLIEENQRLSERVKELESAVR